MTKANNEAPATLRMALNVLPLRVAVLSSSGTVIAVNKRWSEFAARTTDPVASQTTGEQYLAGLDDADAGAAQEVATGIRSVLEEQKAVMSVECRIDHDSGTMWNLFRAAAFETSDGRFVGIAAVDISDQRQLVADLRVKERAMDEAPVGITISDPATADNEIIYANNAFERITGYKTEFAVGQNCRFLQGEKTREESVAKIRNAIENREPTVVEVLNYRKSGERFWNEVTIAPLYDDSGGLTHFVGFQRDISERKRAEQQLNVERDQLALLNQLVRHDIRNDMAVILGWGDRLYDQATEQQQEDLLRILNTARHTKQLTESVRDLLELLREDDPELSSVALGDTLRTEIKRVHSSFEYRSDSVTISGEDALPEDSKVLATSLLNSVFGNLLDNAVFHNDKAEVAIRISVEQRAETVVVRVADNGPGVPDSAKRSVFGRGEKGLESPGSGLGLYLVDNLVSTYGGSVWIEDNDPEGSVFCVELRRV